MILFLSINYLNASIIPFLVIVVNRLTDSLNNAIIIIVDKLLIAIHKSGEKTKRRIAIKRKKQLYVTLFLVFLIVPFAVQLKKPTLTVGEAIVELKMAIVPPEVTPTAEQVALEEKASRLHTAVSEYVAAEEESAIKELKTVLKK